MITILAVLQLITVHGPGNQRIDLNVEQITTVREPRATEGHFAPGVRCVVSTTDGKWVGVVETCAQVLDLIAPP